MQLRTIVLALAAVACRVDNAAAGGPGFRVDVEAPACVRGTTCEAKLKLTALDGYKVNTEYPYKFVVKTGAITLDGPGAFEPTTKTTGTYTIKFRADSTAKVTGLFKLSVCTPKTCLVEQPAISFDVRVQ